jgi:hypothetical protein
MGFANFVRISQKSLAEELGIAPSNMSTAVRELIKIGFIAKQADPEDAGRDLLRVSPHLAWRGKPREWSAAVTRGEGAAFAAVPRRAPRRCSKDHGRLKIDGRQHT